MSALPGTTGRRRIYLMRHGHVDYFSEIVRTTGDTRQVPLTELGREQALAAGKALAHVRFDLAMSSGLPRTRETMDVVLSQNAETDHLSPIVEAELQEIHGGGFGEIKRRADISARMAFFFDSAGTEGATMGEGGERFSDALVRCEASIKRLLAKPDWHTALVVAHEGVNRVILGWATGNGLRAVQSFEQDVACINILDFDLVPRESGDGVEIVRSMIKAVNLTPYNYVKFGMNLNSIESIFARY